jgi:hypothetical protein
MHTTNWYCSRLLNKDLLTSSLCQGYGTFASDSRNHFTSKQDPTLKQSYEFSIKTLGAVSNQYLFLEKLCNNYLNQLHVFLFVARLLVLNLLPPFFLYLAFCFLSYNLESQRSLSIIISLYAPTNKCIFCHDFDSHVDIQIDILINWIDMHLFSSQHPVFWSSLSSLFAL